MIDGRAYNAAYQCRGQARGQLGRNSRPGTVVQISSVIGETVVWIVLAISVIQVFFFFLKLMKFIGEVLGALGASQSQGDFWSPRATISPKLPSSLTPAL